MLKLKYLTAATLLAIAGQAGAASVGVTDGSPASADNGNGEFILTVFDADTGVSYSRQLEMFVNDFVPNSLVGVGTPDNIGNATPDAGLTKVFATDALFTSTFGSSDPSTLRWYVVAADSATAGETGSLTTVSTPHSLRLLITHGTSDGTGFNTTTAGVTGATQTNYDDHANGLNNYACGLAAGASCVVTATSDTANGVSFTSATAVSGTAPVLVGLDTVGYFYYLTGQSGSTARPLTTSSINLFANSEGVAGEWSLSRDGTLTWNSAAVSAVPVPAAVWLFGSGLLGLAGVARRKQSA
jgi:hypothetical protein